MRARRLERILTASGTVFKWFEERSKDVKDPARGARAVILMDVKLFSARHKCLRNLHFEGGKVPKEVISEVEP